MTSTSQDIVTEHADDAGVLRRAVILGITSAVSYSAANLALRGLSGAHEDLGWAIWITAMKAVPTMLLALALLFRRYCRKESLFPVRRVLPGLILAAVIMQIGGNLGFQLALGHIGLAITVPLVFAFIICSGAALGRVYLGDPVSKRTVLSMAIMTVSIVLLSYAATLKVSTDDVTTDVSSGKLIWFGIITAVVSGFSYGVNGVVIRRLSQKTLPPACLLIVYSTTGILILGAAGAWMMGFERLSTITTREWQMMACAGVFNAAAFYCVMNAFRIMNISHVNLLNASQNAMCAVGAVLLFAEPVSVPMVAGISLSIVGLLALSGEGRSASIRAARQKVKK